MSKVCLLFLLAAMLMAVGCKTQPSGNREFIPGKGWVPNN